MEEQNNEIEKTPDKKINPWLTIFFRPSHTMRWLLRNETAQSANMLWLSFTALFMVIAFLAQMLLPSLFGRETTKIQLVVVTPIVFALSWLYFVVESYLLSRVSGWFGGRVQVSEMRIINAYTTVIPAVVLGFAEVSLAFLLGQESWIYSIVKNVIVVWTIYISVCGIAVAAGLSPRKGLLIYVSTVLLWIGAIAAGTLFWLVVLPKFF